MVLIKIYPKDTEMYLWSQTSAEGAEDFHGSTSYKIQGMWHSYLEPGRVTTQEPQPCPAEPRGAFCPAPWGLLAQVAQAPPGAGDQIEEVVRSLGPAPERGCDQRGTPEVNRVCARSIPVMVTEGSAPAVGCERNLSTGMPGSRVMAPIVGSPLLREMGLAARRPTMSHEHDPNGDCHDWDMAYSGPGLPPPIRLLSISSWTTDAYIITKGVSQQPYGGTGALLRLQGPGLPPRPPAPYGGKGTSTTPRMTSKLKLRGGGITDTKIPKYTHESKAEFDVWQARLEAALNIQDPAKHLDTVLTTGKLHPAYARKFLAEAAKELGKKVGSIDKTEQDALLAEALEDLNKTVYSTIIVTIDNNTLLRTLGREHHNDGYAAMETIRKRWAVDGSDLDTRAENLDRDRDKHVKEGVQTLTRAEYTKWLERLQDLNAELAGSAGYAWASAVTLRHTLSMIAAHDPAFVTTFKLTHTTQIKKEPDTVLEKLKDHIEELESTDF